MFYKFFHLKLFNIKHKIVHIQIVWRHIFVFQKPCLLQTEENGCLWTYGRSSLILDFKLNGKLMTCSHRDINKFLRYRTLCKSILKCGFSAKGIELTWSVLFEVLRAAQL